MNTPSTHNQARKGSMNKSPILVYIRRFWLATFVIVGMSYAVYFISQHTLQLKTISDVPASFLIILLILQCVMWLLISFTWKIINQAQSGKKIPLYDCFSYMALIGLGKYIPGKIWGIVARSADMYEKHGVSKAQSLEATYVEQFFLLYIGIVMGSIIFLSQMLGVPYFFGALLGVLLILLSAPAYNMSLHFMIRIYLKIDSKISDKKPVTGTEKKPGKRITRPYSIKLSLYFLSIWVISGTILFFLYISLFESAFSFHLYLTVLAANSLSVIIGFFAFFAPGGVGVREGVSSVILSAYMLPGDALTLVLIFRVWVVITEFSSGAIALAIRARLGVNRSLAK